MNRNEALVWSYLSADCPLSNGELQTVTGLSHTDVNTALVALDLRDMVRVLPGSKYARRAIERDNTCAYCGADAFEPIAEWRDDEEYHVASRCPHCGRLTLIKYNLAYYGSEALPTPTGDVHRKRKHGYCDVCGHYGDDCTGEEVSITADIPEARLVNACPDCRKDNACPEHSDWKDKLAAVAALVLGYPFANAAEPDIVWPSVDVDTASDNSFKCVRELDGKLGLHVYEPGGSVQEITTDLVVDDASVQDIAKHIGYEIVKYLEIEYMVERDVQLAQKPIVISYRDGCIACVYGDTNQQVIFVDHDAVRKPMVRSHYMVPTSELSGSTKEAIDARREEF
jgi:hypothetical protein